MNPSSNPIGYSHYQPPPQPIQFPYATQQQQQYTQLPATYPAQLEQLQQRANQLPLPMTNFPPPLNRTTLVGDSYPYSTSSRAFQPHKNVGIGQDFQLFGPSDPLGGIGAGISPSSNDDDDERTTRRQLGSIDSTTVPDLISDRGSPSAVDSPPELVVSSLRPRPTRPSLAATTSSTGGSYREGGGRASSVPPPEFPKPMRRKTQENLHWPSWVSNSGSSSGSSSASSTSNYLPTPQQHPQTSSLPFVEEPYSLPPCSSSSSSSFDPSSFTLSPAAQYSNYQAPHTDHPLLPSEQSDLLDRVRRDLLDVDLSSIKGPLRALALSGSEGSPGQLSMLSPLPSFARYQAGGGSNVFNNGFLVVDRDKTPTPRSSVTATAETTTKQSPRSPAVSALASGGGSRGGGRASSSASIGTVSPQEAFLDYPAVDSKLHDLDPKDGRLARSDFGVGVGHSLFAPLPTTQQQQQQKSAASSSKPSATSASSLSSLSKNKIKPTPTVTPLSPQPQSTTTPRQHQHVPHPFSVPQNAVSWATRRSNSGRHLVGGVVDGDADDDDGDFEEGEPSSSTEVTAGEDEGEELLQGTREKAGLPRGYGEFTKEDVKLDRDLTEVERARYGLEKEGELNGTRPIKEEEEGGEYKIPMETDNDREDEEKNKFSFVPPPPSHAAVLQFASPRRGGSSTTTTGTSGTSTPRRAAAANALAGLQARFPDDQDEDEDDNDSSSIVEPTRAKRQRKRSRLALEEEDSNFSDRDAEGSSDEYKEGGERAGDDDEDEDVTPSFAPPLKRSKGGGGGGNDSDGSYHSSSGATTPAPSTSKNSTSSTAPPPKRRRRAPAATSSNATSKSSKPATKGSIACDFVSSEGDRCGVVFRRPYDLARHKETIHGVTMGGEKLPPGKAKEWKCKECGGTFSRKDALLRHGRIRGHKPGV